MWVSRGVAIINVKTIVCEHSYAVTQLKVLVFRIKIGATEDQNRHFSAGSMANSRRDQDCGTGCDRVPHPIQEDRRIGFALQNHVHLGVFAVEVFLSVLADLRQVHRSGEFLPISERPTGHPAGTSHRW